MKVQNIVVVLSTALIGVAAPGFAQADRSGHGGGGRGGGGGHYGGGHGGGGHYSGGGHGYGGGHYGGYGGGHGYGGGGRYYGGGYRGGYGGYGYGVGLGLLGAAIAAPYYYSQPYGYAPAPVYGYADPGYPQQYAQPASPLYFCRSYNAYYPQVNQCPEGWQQVMPQGYQY